MWLSWRLSRLSAAIRILLRQWLEEPCAQWTCAGMSRITYSYIRRRLVTTTSPHSIARWGLDCVLFPVWVETGAPGSSADFTDRQCGHHICGQGPRASRWDQIVGYVRLGFPPSHPAEDVLNVATAFACGQLALPIGGDDPYWAAFPGCDLNDDKVGVVGDRLLPYGFPSSSTFQDVGLRRVPVLIRHEHMHQDSYLIPSLSRGRRLGAIPASLADVVLCYIRTRR